MNDDSLDLLGVNLAGGDFGSVGQAYGTGYIYPSHDEIDYEAARGMNVIRLPFLWERLQSTLGGPLAADELARIDDVVTYAASKGLHVVLDLHNYGKFGGQLVGSARVPQAAFADFWGKLAAHYASTPGVMFGLMNEPQQPSASDWLGAVNAAIAAIRNAGATQEVLVPGVGWDGAWTWTTGQNASTIGERVIDPGSNFAFELHQYLDSDGSGTHAAAVSSTIGSQRLAAVTAWAEQNGQRLFLGEFGASRDATSLAALGDMLSFMSRHTDVWQGGTYWAAGPWWGDYMYSAEPTDGVDTPQMTVLEAYAHRAAATSSPTTVAAATSGQAGSAASSAVSAQAMNSGTAPVLAQSLPASAATVAAYGISAAAPPALTIASDQTEPSDATSDAGEPLAATATPVASPPTGAAVSVSFDPSATMTGRRAVILTGTVSDPTASVRVLAGSSDLGAATVAPDGTWTLSAKLAPGAHPDMTVIASLGGNSAVAAAPFAITAGIRGEPYVASVDAFDASGRWTGITEYDAGGDVYLSQSRHYTADGGSTDLYSGGSSLAAEGLRTLSIHAGAAGNVASTTQTVTDGGGFVLSGTSGRDTFVFAPNFGHDTVADFTTRGGAHDVLGLPASEFGSLAAVLGATRQTADGVVIRTAEGDSLLLAGVSKSQLVPQDFKLHG